jgi:hypothetical protein
MLDGIVTGEKPDKVQDQSDEVIAAQEAIRRRLALVTFVAKREELARQGAALGL